MSLSIKFPAKENTPQTHLPFSPATQLGNLLFVSGQASVSPDGHILPGTFEEECRRSFDNLKAVLETCGSSLRAVVKVNNFVRNAEDLESFNKIYREYFNPPYPARTTLTDCLPETLKFEVDCIAVCPNP